MATPAPLAISTTDRVRDACLCLHAQRAARTLARYFDEALRPAKLSNAQFSLLMALNRTEPPAMGDVARLLGADRTTLTAALKPLVREGLAAIGIDPLDARVRRAALTPAGHGRLTQALPLWQRAHDALEADMEGAAPARLRQDLRAIAALSSATAGRRSG